MYDTEQLLAEELIEARVQLVALVALNDPEPLLEKLAVPVGDVASVTVAVHWVG